MERRYGAPAWLELNTPRPAEGQRFYRELFCWSVRPIHLDPAGLMPVFSNGGLELASVFMALESFASSQWLPFFSGDVDRALDRVPAGGGEIVEEPTENPGWGRTLVCRDPAGASFTLFEREGGDPRHPSRPGDAVACELWSGGDAGATASFYASVFGLETEPTSRGWTLTQDGEARIWVRKNPFHPPPNPWIPYFRSSSVRADRRRAHRHGALEQVPRETVPDLGDLVVLLDPCGAVFGLVSEAEADPVP